MLWIRIQTDYNLLSMGVIYSPEQVAAERVPSRDDLLHGAKLLHASLQELFNQILIRHAVIHGSVPEQRHNRRSDIDVYVVYCDHAPEAFTRVEEARKNVYEQTGAIVEYRRMPTSFSAEVIALAMQDPLYEEYLVERMHDLNGWTIGWPHKEYVEAQRQTSRYKTTTVRAIGLYMLHKAQKFTDRTAATFDDDPRALLSLQRALELPRSLCRKVKRGYRYEKNYQIADTKELLGLLALDGFFPKDEDVLEALFDLQDIDILFTNLTESFGAVDAGIVADYHDLLRTQYEVVIPRARFASIRIAQHISTLGDNYPYL